MINAKIGFMKKGITVVEIIISLGILGAVICPLMSLFIMSQKINHQSEVEHKSMLSVQKYMEEIQLMDDINLADYTYDSENGYYQRKVNNEENDFSVEILIKPYTSGIVYSIEIVLKNDGLIINSLNGTKIFKNRIK